jgi:hypothetical protein
MDASEFNKLMAKVGISTTVQFARLLGRNRSWFSLLTHGKRPIPPELAALLRLLATGKISIADVEHALGTSMGEALPPGRPARDD